MCTCMCMRVSIQQLLSATTDEDVKAVVSEGNDTILNCGYTKPLSKLCLDNCSQLVDAMLLPHFVLSRVAQLEQFREGLKILGFFQLVCESAEKCSSLLVNCGGDQAISASSLIKLIQPMHVYMLNLSLAVML